MKEGRLKADAFAGRAGLLGNGQVRCGPPLQPSALVGLWPSSEAAALAPLFAVVGNGRPGLTGPSLPCIKCHILYDTVVLNFSTST